MNRGYPEDISSDSVIDKDNCSNPGCSQADTQGCLLGNDSDSITDCDDDCPNQSGPQNNKGSPSSSKPVSDSITSFIKFLFILLLIVTIIGIILFIWKRKQKKATSKTRTYDDDTRFY